MRRYELTDSMLGARMRESSDGEWVRFDEIGEQFAPNHKLCYRCNGSGRERGRFLGVDPGDCLDCGGKGLVFKGTPPSDSRKNPAEKQD